MGTFAAQLRQVLRRLGRAPLFTAITLITLAVGVGANAGLVPLEELPAFTLGEPEGQGAGIIEVAEHMAVQRSVGGSRHLFVGF